MVAIELVVADLDRAVELFCDVLGGTLLSRGPAALVAGESAIVDANGLLISLLAPASSGEGTVLVFREPRVSQLVFTATDDTAEATAMAAGLSVAPMANGFHLTPESVEGALGFPIAVVVSRVDG